MKSNASIPPGFILLKPDDVIKEGDLYYSIDEANWTLSSRSVFSPGVPAGGDYQYIRKAPTEPEKPTVAQVAQAIVVTDFIKTVEDALLSVGGGSWSAFKDLTLEQAAKIFAPNGIRFCYTSTARVEGQMTRAESIVGALKNL